MKSKKGYHICADLYGCEKKLLDDITFIRKALQGAIKFSGLKTIETKVYKFNPHGITGYAVLTASHIALHTWPEYNYISLDIFACESKKRAEKAMEFLLKKFKPKKIKKTILERGFLYSRQL